MRGPRGVKPRNASGPRRAVRDNAGMQKTFAGRVLVAVLAGLVVLASPARAAAPKKSPFVEVLGQGTVLTAPRETTHKNRRKFLEFEIRLSSAGPTASQPQGADIHLALDTTGRVRVVHDLSCGGAAVALSVGDRIEIQGEYVHVPKGQDLIHFTHAADGKCAHGEDGGAGKHPGGFLRKVARAADAPPGGDRAGSALHRAAASGERAPVFQRSCTAKEKGASNAELLAKVESEHMAYSLTTPEIQNLRAAGVSDAVIEAMLRSGRAQTPGAATPAPTPR